MGNASSRLVRHSVDCSSRQEMCSSDIVLAAQLSKTFREGVPSGELAHAGVLVRAFDKLSIPLAHWLPSQGPGASLWSSSVVSRKSPYAYSKASDGAFVLNPALAADCIRCSFHHDFTTSTSFTCPRRAPAPLPANDSTAKRRYVPTDDACIVGCVAANCDLRIGYSCNHSRGRSKQLAYTLRHQLRHMPWLRHHNRKLPPYKRHYHNEIVLDYPCLRSRLPHVVLGVVRNLHTQEGYNVTVEAVATHRHFLAAFNLLPGAMPFLEMNLSDMASPFRATSSHDLNNIHIKGQ